MGSAHSYTQPQFWYFISKYAPESTNTNTNIIVISRDNYY